MTELEKCPFCGGDEIIRSVDGGIPPDHCEVTERYVTTCTLYCEKCGAKVQGFGASDSSTNGLYRVAVDECYKAWNTRAERTCRNLDKHHNIMFKCSECGHWECQDFDGEKILPQTWNYCPNCGAKVVDNAD